MYAHRHGHVRLPHLFDAKDLNPIGRYRVPVCGGNLIFVITLHHLAQNQTGKVQRFLNAIVREKQFRNHKATVWYIYMLFGYYCCNVSYYFVNNVNHVLIHKLSYQVFSLIH